MRFLQKILARKERDAEMERELGIPKNDPDSKRYGGFYSRADIERLEEEMVPWLRRKRQKG